jgi:predicted SnoaL-like aldol condensation-catalyzing enzyme
MSSDDGTPAPRELVLAFIEAFYNEKDFERAAGMLAEDFANHHPGVGVGRQRTVETFSRWVAEPLPDLSLTVRRVIAEGELVVTHSHLVPTPGATGAAVVDIWRVAGGRLAEKWDVGQDITADSSVDEMLGGD